MDKKLIEKALEYHSEGKAGKIEVQPSKSADSPEKLSLAYSPGVAAPAMEIDKERWKAYKYTNKGNLIAVISNGSAVLGLGNIGALASKPVMEGKAMLFKLYADIDAFDIEISDESPDSFVKNVQALSPTFGGINLEDIKAPECFYIEERLRSLVDIPVLHDDQHGTAVTVGAALINACEITGKKIKDIKCVICGAGSAGLSTARMLIRLGLDKKKLIIADSKGVITTLRTDIDKYKKEFATERDIESLDDAMKGADVFIGLSKGNLLKEENITSMAENPIVFALANPVPEIDYSKAKNIRPDAIVATGLSNHPNQINNVLAFPYLFRGALDTLSTTINKEMLIAASHAIAGIARKYTPKDIEERYNRRLKFGRDYILPKPGDIRLLTDVSVAVAEAAMKSGVARRPIASFKEYITTLLQRIDNENFFIKERMHHNNTKRVHNYYSREREF